MAQRRGLQALADFLESFGRSGAGFAAQTMNQDFSRDLQDRSRRNNLVNRALALGIDPNQYAGDDASLEAAVAAEESRRTSSTEQFNETNRASQLINMSNAPADVLREMRTTIEPSLRREGTENVIAAAEANELDQFIQGQERDLSTIPASVGQAGVPGFREILSSARASGVPFTRENAGRFLGLNDRAQGVFDRMAPGPPAMDNAQFSQLLDDSVPPEARDAAIRQFYDQGGRLNLGQIAAYTAHRSGDLGPGHISNERYARIEQVHDRVAGRLASFLAQAAGFDELAVEGGANQMVEMMRMTNEEIQQDPELSTFAARILNSVDQGQLIQALGPALAAEMGALTDPVERGVFYAGLNPLVGEMIAQAMNEQDLYLQAMERYGQPVGESGISELEQMIQQEVQRRQSAPGGR